MMWNLTDWFPNTINTLPHVTYLHKSRFNKLDYRKIIIFSVKCLLDLKICKKNVNVQPFYKLWGFNTAMYGRTMIKRINADQAAWGLYMMVTKYNNLEKA